ncbi:MAG: response regulator [Desulfobacterales bacterium]|nr:response regulator [Desulfobacterales bacterium]
MTEITILLVDDEAAFRQALSRRLNKRGFNVLQADSGSQCLSMLNNHSVSVIIMDVKMPEMSGIETLRQIKKKYPDKVEVILLTGQVSAQDGVTGIKIGAFDYLTKPVEIDHLAEKIKQANESIIRKEERIAENAFREKVAHQMAAAERLASLGTLATGIAHEINNPLAIINESAGFLSQILARQKMLQIPCRKEFELSIDKIITAVERAGKITHQLLGFARNGHSDYTRVDLPELIAESIDLLTHEMSNRNIDITTSFDPLSKEIMTDPFQLRQVFINLLSNANYAVGENGRISISTANHGQEVAISIQDTGPGIPANHIEKIFEPFFTTKPPNKGTGLGLFVTRNIIDKLGGSIRVDSKLNVGTTFRVVLPKCLEMQIKAFETENSATDWISHIKGESYHDKNSD